MTHHEVLPLVKILHSLLTTVEWGVEWVLLSKPGPSEKHPGKPGMEVHVCNPSTRGEGGGKDRFQTNLDFIAVWDQLKLYRNTLSKKESTNIS